MGANFSTFPTKTFHLWFLMGAETFFLGPKTFLSPFEPAERKVLERGKEGGLEGGGEVERRSEGQ